MEKGCPQKPTTRVMPGICRRGTAVKDDLKSILYKGRKHESEAKQDVVRRLSRSTLKHAQPGAECRESGTFRSEWSVGKAIFPSTPNYSG